MNTIDILREAHQALRAAVPAKRKRAHQTEGKLAAAFREAMELWDDMKSKGGTLLDLTAGLERIFRSTWPKGECSCPRCRWTCRECEDTGALFERRPAAIYGGRIVDVVVPCHCANGRRFMPKPRFSDDFKSAGKTTRAGR